MMNKRMQTDIAVIGGGVVGAAVAAEMARTGAAVTLLERGEFPWGSSKRCDGHVVTYDSAPGFFSRFSKAALDLFHERAHKLPCDIHFEPEGLGLLVDDERDLEQALANYEGKKAEGVKVGFWDQAELRRHEPNIADDILACVNFEGDAKLNPMRLTFALIQQARDLGAKPERGVTVTGLGLENGAVRRVETDRGVLEAETVVLCAGVWTPGLAHMAGVNVPIRPRQGHLIVTERVSGLIGKNYAEFGYLAAKGGKKRPGVTPAMEQYGVALVLEPTAEGTIIMGSSRRFVGMNTEVEPHVLQAMVQRGIRFFPNFARTKIIRTFAGLRPASIDGYPIISPTHVRGLYVASGHEGNGISLSLITGKLTAEMLQGLSPSLDMAPLHLDRFGLNPPAVVR